MSGILDRLRAAGLIGARDRAQRLAEIAAVKGLLRKLQKEHQRATSRDFLATARQDPAFEARRLDGCRRYQRSAAFREMIAKRDRSKPNPLLLPPMTRKQRGRYNYLKYGCKLSRQAALTEVLGA